MGIPGLSSFVWANRDKISSHFVCNSNKRTYTLQRRNKETTKDDNDFKEKQTESMVIKTVFDRKREWIIFDGYSITSQFFSAKKSPLMDFYRIKTRLNNWIDCWLSCGFKLIFVFDGYAAWINNEKKEEKLKRSADRYRDIKHMNQHLNKFHEYYNNNIIQSRYDNYISEAETKSDNSERDIEEKTDERKTNDATYKNVNWLYSVKECMYSGYSTFTVNIFHSLCKNKENVLVWNTKSEADQQIAGWVNAHADQVFGICSTDSDFFVFDYKNIWIINAQSIKYKTTNKYMRYGNTNRYKSHKSNSDINLGNYINDANNVEYPCVSFVATKSEDLWNYMGLGDNYEQRLFYAQIVGMDLIEKKDAKNFVEEFKLENKIKDVNDRNEIAFAIVNIVKLYCLEKENKIEDKIKEFYEFKPLDLCSDKSVKDELLIEGYCINKHMFECVKSCVIPIFVALKPIRMMMYKRCIIKIKNNKIKEYTLLYDNDTNKIDLQINEIGINDLNDCKSLPYPQINDNNDNNNNNNNWSVENTLLLLIEINNYLNAFNILNRDGYDYKNKANAMILQLKWRRIYTSNTYSIYKDNDVDNNWNIKHAVKIFRHFSKHSMPKPIDLYIQSLFMKCVEYFCWDIQTPPIELLFCGPLFHFICQHQTDDCNQLLPLLAQNK